MMTLLSIIVILFSKEKVSLVTFLTAIVLDFIDIFSTVYILGVK